MNKKIKFKRPDGKNAWRQKEKKEKEKKCALCGTKHVIFLTGSGQKAILNDTDCTEAINAYWGKGKWLCKECVFK